MNEDLKVCGIYGIFDTLTEECLYVGQSKNIYERRRSHFKRLRGERHLKSFTEWFVSIGKDESRLDLRVLCRCLDNDDIKNKLEIFWFNELHSRFYGAVPSINNRWSHSEETRKKIKGSLYCGPYKYMCQMCGIDFESQRKRHHKSFFCSSECAHKYAQSQKRDKLVYDDVLRLYLSGMSQVELSKSFNVSTATISRFMRDNGISTGYKRHDPGLKRKSGKTNNADVV